jgi:hypothetical protein
MIDGHQPPARANRTAYFIGSFKHVTCHSFFTAFRIVVAGMELSNKGHENGVTANTVQPTVKGTQFR